jgi:AcrR family transcriptional regulator
MTARRRVLVHHPETVGYDNADGAGVLVHLAPVSSTPESPSTRIAAEIRHRITTGHLRPGDRIPSARQITREYGVALATATRVLAALRNDGLVRAVPGVGTVVVAPGPLDGSPVRGTSGADGARTRRPDGPELSRERVVRAAVTIADAEGLAGLSMRRAAAELGTPTMSLYRHVSSKDELVLLMVDAVFADHPPPPGAPDDAGSWRAGLETEARIQWDVYRRHRWLAEVLSMSRPQLMPNGARHTEWVMHALDPLGLDPGVQLHATVTLFAYVRGIAINFEAEDAAERDTGMTSVEWMDAQDAANTAFFEAGPFPTLARLSRDHPEVSLDLESLFEFGLHRLLDGFAVLFGDGAPGATSGRP